MLQTTSTRIARQAGRIAILLRLAIALVALASWHQSANGQIPAAVREAVERAESAKQNAIQASNRNDYPTAIREMARCLDALRQAESASTTGELREIIRDVQGSEKNRTILFCFTGVDDSNFGSGISNEWRQRIEKLDPPQSVANPQDMVPLDWKVYMAYGGLQQHLADYYIRNKDYSRANWHFATAETYFQKYEETAPQNMLADQEQRQWRALNKKRLTDLLATKGITEGIYVQNAGVLQKWIGKVISVDGSTITVRITYASSAAPRGFMEGKDISLKRDELKGVESLSIDAAIRGYK